MPQFVFKDMPHCGEIKVRHPVCCIRRRRRIDCPKKDLMRRTSASLFAVSFLVGVFCYSIRDLAHSSISGPAWFLVGFLVTFVPLYIYIVWAANQSSIRADLRRLRQMDELEREGMTDGRR